MATETDSVNDGVRLCHAILKSHWGFNLTDDEVAVCVRHCDHEQLVVKNAAMLALVLSGHVDQAPRGDLDAWFGRQATEPAANAVAQWRQQEFLNQLSAHPSGRAYLLERLTAADTSPAIARDVARLLLARIAAARKLQRYDFLSLHESNAILLAHRVEEGIPQIRRRRMTVQGVRSMSISLPRGVMVFSSRRIRRAFRIVRGVRCSVSCWRC